MRIVFLGLGLAVLGAGAQGRGSAGSAVGAASAAYKEGLTAYAAGDVVGARKDFERAVRLAPKVAAGHAALGAVLRDAGDLSAAEKELGVAVGLDPAEQTALLNLAVVQAEEGKSAEAVATLTRVKEVPADAGVALPLAAALNATGHAGEAEALLRRGDAQDAAVADALGTVEAGEGKFAEAAVDLQRAIGLDITRPEGRRGLAHYHLGSVWLALGKNDEAVKELEVARGLEPGNAAYVLQLAKALQAAGQDAGAVAALRAGLVSARGGDAGEMRYRLALALQLAGDTDGALTAFRAVVVERPRDAEALTNAGLAEVQAGHAPEGVALYQRAEALGPASATLLEDLGVAYLQEGSLEAALREFKAGLAVDGNSPQLHYDLGLALKLKDDLAGAVPEFEKAAALDGSLPDPPYTLGVIYMQQGKFAESAADLEKAVALRPDNGEAWATLGSVYKQLEEPAKAEAALRKAIALMPAVPSPHITLAAVLSAGGKKDEAAAERKIGAELTRKAVGRQKAEFGVNSGTALLKKGDVAGALVQFEDAVEADPGYEPAVAGLAEAKRRAAKRDADLR